MREYRQWYKEENFRGVAQVGGHFGYQATWKRVQQYFPWVGLKPNLESWVAECESFQRVKAGHVPYPETFWKYLTILQPLPIPETFWKYLTIDFISGFPNSKGFEVIWVVSDRLSRYSHFVPISSFLKPWVSKSLEHSTNPRVHVPPHKIPAPGKSNNELVWVSLGVFKIWSLDLPIIMV